MEKRELYKFYTFGWDFHILGSPYKEIKIESIEHIIKKFKRFIKLYNFKVTEQAIENDPNNILAMTKNLEKQDVAPENVVKAFQEFGRKIETTIDAELKLTHAYILDEKRLGLNRLLSNVNELFGDNVFKNLSSQAQKDFVEAGNCLAFERYTASAFHILRATEDMLGVYYKHKIKQKRVKKLLWQPMTEHLSRKRGVPPALIAVLDNIRLDFRNPTAHPEKFYGEDEVQKLFSHCVDVVNRIVHEINKK